MTRLRQSMRDLLRESMRQAFDPLGSHPREITAPNGLYRATYEAVFDKVGAVVCDEIEWRCAR
jgi:hypothetical protein